MLITTELSKIMKNVSAVILVRDLGADFVFVAGTEYVFIYLKKTINIRFEPAKMQSGWSHM